MMKLEQNKLGSTRKKSNIGRLEEVALGKARKKNRKHLLFHHLAATIATPSNVNTVMEVDRVL